MIGFPVGHSMSPPIHNAGFDAVGVNGVYLPMPIPAEYEHFKATLSTWLAMPELHFGGASVTIPHKENLLRFVKEQGGPGSEIEELAKRIGAAYMPKIHPVLHIHGGNPHTEASRGFI